MVNNTDNFTSSQEINLPGQPSVLHSSVSFDGPRPAQSFPPCCGGGLVHVRERLCIPPSHEAEQSLQSPQLV